MRNADAGLVHDFAVTSLGVAVLPLQFGATGSVVFRAPREKGAYPYVCQPHAQMMRGQLEVAGPPGSWLPPPCRAGRVRCVPGVADGITHGQPQQRHAEWRDVDGAQRTGRRRRVPTPHHSDAERIERVQCAM